MKEIYRSLLFFLLLAIFLFITDRENGLKPLNVSILKSVIVAALTTIIVYLVNEYTGNKKK